MATTAALAATSDAIKALLDRASPTAGLGTITVTVAALTDLAPPATGGAPRVTVWLHRVSANGSRRMLPPRIDRQTGEARQPPFPLDLHYFVTAWAGTPNTQQRVLAWAIRVLEDTPILPATLLNVAAPGCFDDDETVELVWSPLTTTEEIEIWQVAQAVRQPSASYVARMVAIETDVDFPQASEAQATEFQYETRVPA